MEFCTHKKNRKFSCHVEYLTTLSYYKDQTLMTSAKDIKERKRGKQLEMDLYLYDPKVSVDHLMEIVHMFFGNVRK